MVRKLIVGGVVAAALLAGLTAVSAYVIASDHATRVPAAGAPAAKPAADSNEGAALDLSNWQETRETIAGSDSVPRMR